MSQTKFEVRMKYLKVLIIIIIIIFIIIFIIIIIIIIIVIITMLYDRTFIWTSSLSQDGWIFASIFFYVDLDYVHVNKQTKKEPGQHPANSLSNRTPWRDYNFPLLLPPSPTPYAAVAACGARPDIWFDWLNSWKFNASFLILLRKLVTVQPSRYIRSKSPR